MWGLRGSLRGNGGEHDGLARSHGCGGDADLAAVAEQAARVDDRLVISGISCVLRTGAPWRDLPERYGPRTTVYDHWAKGGSWLRIFEALAGWSPGSLPLSDSSIVRAHQHAAGGRTGVRITPSVAPAEA